ncbi:aminotransferase class I/II-fold pyridoxal phosphate-dependent enzyme [Catenuloplanes atrovinosus]|uniref:DNA-binding transcriptional MocR family regulator n=1 Tax=Catenuloplanes atrovinosus TaxID=137266 RepID=A0AAE3YKD1_9ACTN|nr:aminotransferase class I/II-fold pyridoxal phosphate-dependent enzyme [Catenuloplanes atrovinosus]MDR7273441.1 DNA-binding transcriptional MocR family regulator [Catenuloplanes atrovinosus]
MAEHYQITGSTAAEISESVEAGVRAGDLRPGAALPPVRALAKTLRCSPATVAKAYQALRQRGLIETAGRNGTRVRERPPIATAGRSALRLPPPPGAIDLSTGEPDLALLPALGPRLARLAAAEFTPTNYTDAGALPELVDLARVRFAGDGIPVEDAGITVTSGALDAMERLLSAHLRPGDKVAVEDPGWSNAFDLVAALGLTAVPMPVDDEGPTPDGMRAALGAGAGAVIVTARAQNPTGAAVSSYRAAELRSVLAEFASVLLIEDDHAAELAPVTLHSLAGVTGSWAFVRSVSKPYGPDLRLAVVAGDEATIARVAGRMRVGAGWVSTLLQRVVLYLWRDDEVINGVIRARDSYVTRRLALRAALAAHGLDARGRTGLNVWVSVPDETRAVAALRDAGYVVAPGSLFRLASPPAIRITVSPLAEEDIPALADAVAAAAALDPVPARSSMALTA